MADTVGDTRPGIARAVAKERIDDLQNETLRQFLLLDSFLQHEFLHEGPTREHIEQRVDEAVNYQHFVTALDPQDFDAVRENFATEFGLGPESNLITEIDDDLLGEMLETLSRLHIA